MQNDDIYSQSGMSAMSQEEQGERRKQIKDIMRDPNMSQVEKSRYIQSLMDGRRRSSIGSVTSTGVSSNFSDDSDAIMTQADDPRPDDISYGYDDYRSVASEITHDQPHQQIPQGTYRQFHGRSYSLQDWNDHDRVVAAANATNSGAMTNPAYMVRLMEQSRPPCQHYDRNCTIISPCCGLAFGCRICHDECPVLPPPFELRKGNEFFANKIKAQERRRSMPADLGGGTDEENHHPIDRFAIAEVICRECYLRQPAKSNRCVGCNVQFGEYHCGVCNLWMSNSEKPYHCEECGFCRVGGRENFKHCSDCGMCIDAALFDDHNCKSGKYMSNCPICQEDLFSSRHASHEMPCGHAIHWHCFKELTTFDTRCPVCKKTAETPDQMAATWDAITMGISLQPVPPDMARVVNIYCNDCEMQEPNRRWHFLGVRCNYCMSYNTIVEQIVMHGLDASEFLDRIERESRSGNIPTSISAPMISNNDDMMMEDAPSAQETSAGSSNAMDST